MTNMELADLTEKRHDDVKRTIDTLVNHVFVPNPQIFKVTRNV
jgi:phage regulator Rha-like protein